MKRREFIVGGVAAAWPVVGRAQQPNRMRRIGLLAGSSGVGGGRNLINCFLAGLRNLGWIEGENIEIDTRWAEGSLERYSLFATELANSRPDLIVVTSTPGTKAVQRTTRNIPVVFMGVSDPVTSAIVTSLSRPGGNITGVSNFLPATSGKLIELMKIAVPRSARLGVIYNPGNAGKILELRELQTAGRALSISVLSIEVRSSENFPDAFSKITQEKCDGLITLQEGVTLASRKQIVEYALTSRLPTVFQIKEFVEVGGLMSYGLNYCQHYRRGATYVDKILKGAQPADLPVELPTKFELVINLKTAEALGIEIPPMLLATADEVIE